MVMLLVVAILVKFWWLILGIIILGMWIHASVITAERRQDEAISQALEDGMTADEIIEKFHL